MGGRKRVRRRCREGEVGRGREGVERMGGREGGRKGDRRKGGRREGEDGEEKGRTERERERWGERGEGYGYSTVYKYSTLQVLYISHCLCVYTLCNTIP